MESDPTSTVNITFDGTPVAVSTSTGSTAAAVSPCKAESGQITIPANAGNPPITYDYAVTCGRQWTFAQAYAPVGFKYSLRTRHALQPFLVGTAGYMYSNRPIPIADAGPFKFTFDFGAGLDLFRTKSRSMSLECRYHHFSNKDSAAENPGMDNLVFKASYSFGR